MEDNILDSQARGAASSMSIQSPGKEALADGEDLDAWNPMKDDYTNKAFNDYSEPTIEELKKWMPRKGEENSPVDLMACYRSEDGDVRLFINGIPPELTQEGIRGLFNQVGKVAYCKVIPLRDPNRKDTFGFVGYKSYREAERAIRTYDGFSIGNNMRLRVSLSKNKSKHLDSPIPDYGMMAAIPTGVVNGEADDEGHDWDAEMAEDSTVAMEGSVAMGDNMVAKEDNAVAIGTSNVASGDNTMVQENHTAVLNQDIPVDAPSTDKSSHPDQVRPASTTDEQSNIVQCNGHDVQTSSSNVALVNGIDSTTSSGQQSKPKIPEEPCTVCGKGGHNRCSSCKAPYCSRQCQRVDWPEHKKHCNWKKQEELAKSNNEPDLPNEAELEFSGLDGFASIFGLDRLVAENNLTFEDEPSSSHNSHYGYIQPLTSARETATITEIASEDEELLKEEPKSPLITEISPQETQFQSTKPKEPLITDDAESSATLPLISEVSAERSSQNKPSDNSEESEVSMSTPCHDNSAVDEEKVLKEQESGPKVTEIQQPARTNSINVTSQPSQQSLQEDDSPPSEKKANDVVGYSRYRINDVPLEIMSVGSWYDIVVTSVSSPTMFWAQLFQDNTLEKQTYLLETLGTLYNGPVPKPYVPTPGDVCVTQYTKDNNWYRCKVDYINNNGLITVTHIDFGSTEDVDPSRIRRITRELVSIPRQALKCSLHFPTAHKVSWSPEAVEDFGARVLDVKCRAEVKEVRDSVSYLDVYDSNGILVNDIFAERKETGPPTGTRQDTPVDTTSVPTAQDPHLPSVVPTEGFSLPAALDVIQSPSQLEMMATPPQESEDTTTPPSVPCISSVPLVLSREQVQPSEQTPVQPSPESPSATLVLQKTQNIPTSPTVQSVPPIPHVSPREEAQPREQNPVLPTSPNLATALPPQKQEVTSTSSSDSRVPHVPLSIQTPAQPSSPSPTLPSPPVMSTPSGVLSSSSSEADLSSKSPLPSTPQPGHFVHRTKFEGVVSSVVSPREFQVVLTDPTLLEKLEELSNQLNAHCAATPYNPSAIYSYNDTCAVKSTTDKEWHRCRVLFNSRQGTYSVQLMDLDTKETVSLQNMLHIPDWFKSFPPRSVLCSLGGVTKRAGTAIFGRDAIDKFKSLVLNKKFTFKEISRFKNTYIVEMLDESGQASVAKELIDAGLADAYLKKVRSPIHTDGNDDTWTMSPSILLTCKVAITTAKLPPPGQVFQVTPTEFESPGSFFIHLKDDESQQKLDGISKEMNQYYNNMAAPSDWQARERQLCAALFKSSWLRAFVKDINADNVVTIICVDFGNIEVVSTAALRPLAPQFSALPYCALHCSLANVQPIDGNCKEWSKEAIDFVRMKMPLSSTLDVSLIFKGQTILFIDVFLPNKESLCQLLAAKKLAFFKGKREPRYPGSSPKGSPPKETRFTRNRSKEERSPPFRPNRSQEREAQPSPRELAIMSARLPPVKGTLKAIAVHIESPGCFFIQIADREMVSKVAVLHKDMSSHYSTTPYPPFQPTPNQVCAAQFTMEADTWFRGWIKSVEDGKAYVYYPDYGNSELVDASNLRPLEARFSTLPFSALSCSLGSIKVEGDWSQEAVALFKDKLRLYEAFDAKVVFKKRDCICLDILDPQNPSTTLSKELVARNLATWFSERKPKVDGTDHGMNHRRDYKPVEYQPNYMPTDARTSPSITENQEKINEIAVLNRQENTPATTSQENTGTSATTFQGNTSTSATTFQENTSTPATTFKENTSIPATTFKENTSTPATTFQGNTSTPATTFQGNISTPATTFQGNTSTPATTFQGNTSTQATTFQGNTSTPATTFQEKTSTPATTFQGNTSTPATTFQGNTSTPATTFQGNTSTPATTFQEKTSTQATTFQGNTTTPATTFQGNTTTQATTFQGNTTTPAMTFQGNTSTPVKKYFLQSLPSVTVSPGVFHNAMVCDIKNNGVVSLQILTKELKELVVLGANINSHCNDLDHTPYSPIAGELCLARFSDDMEWYRAAVNEALPNDEFKVSFLDYGNEDVVSCQDIRRMDEKFLYLPRQAYSGTLKGLTSVPDSILKALKSRLLEKRILVRVDNTAIEFFDVDSNNKPSDSINEEILEILYPKLNLPKEIDMEFVGLVTEVHGTGKIWIQYRYEPDIITDLMADVKTYCESSGALPVTSLPSPGELLFAKHSFFNNWHRVKVLECKGPQSVQVLFVDYGYSEEVSLDKLRRGKPELMRISFFAVKCYLVRVTQRNADADDFVKQILNRAFKTKICEKHGEELGVELEDYDVPNGPLNINDYLIGFGYQA